MSPTIYNRELYVKILPKRILQTSCFGSFSGCIRTFSSISIALWELLLLDANDSVSFLEGLLDSAVCSVLGGVCGFVAFLAGLFFNFDSAVRFDGVIEAPIDSH